MWRHYKFQEREDSDQSISEDEEYKDGDLGANYASLGGISRKEEGLQLQTQRKMLVGSDELNFARATSNLSRVWNCHNQKQTSPTTSLEDEFEVPDSPNEGDLGHSRKPALKRISDEENGILSHVTELSHKDDHHCHRSEQDDVAAWSAVTKETEALMNLNGNAKEAASFSSANPEARKHVKGAKGKGKPKFSFHFNSLKEIPKSFEIVDQAIEDDPIADSLEDFDEQTKSCSSSMVVQHRSMEQSISDLLDGLQDNGGLAKGNFKMRCRRKGKSLQLTCKRSRITLEDGATDDEILEPMDGKSSSDDEPNCENLVPPILEKKKQFVADRFHEALEVSSVWNKGSIIILPKLSGSSGLFEKLQRIMLREKERETNFLKKLHAGDARVDESGHIDVKILSRCLDARLIVCKCSFIRNPEDPPLPDSPRALVNERRERTIIFNPKVCVNVDLEVGSFIRIHTPWNEVRANGTEETVILCTYFSDLVN